VVSGTYTLESDISPVLRNVDVTVDAGADLIFDATQHVAGLTINGEASLSAGGAKVLVTKALTIGASGQLDLADNDLVLDYSAVSPIGTWTAGAYDGITGMIQRGRNGGGWNGLGGIVSSSASGSLTSLAVAEASDVLNIDSMQTGVFSGETVDGSAVLVKFTYGGDANLDGHINVDDYGKIDFFASLAATGYHNGDFNYDGVVNVDDYGIIDFNVGIQGLPL